MASTRSLTIPRFSSLVGMRHVERAVRVACYSEHIRTILITGPTGTGKSAATRALESIPGLGPIRRIGPGVTEDRVVGHLDIEKTLRFGRPRYRPGILAEADGGVVILENACILPPPVLRTVLAAALRGHVLVEREGCSLTVSTRITLVATSISGEEELPSGTIDDFDLAVQTVTLSSVHDRCAVVEGSYPSGSHPVSDTVLGEERRPSVSHDRPVLTDDQIEVICKGVSLLSPHGNRREIVTAHCAEALAALDGRVSISETDIKTAFEMTLSHLGRKPSEPSAPQQQSAGLPENESSRNSPESKERENDFQSNGTSHSSDTARSEGRKATVPEGTPRGDTGTIGREVPIPSFLPRLVDRRNRSVESGRRTRTGTRRRMGRYIRFRIPTGAPRDIAVDATLRVAALNRKSRCGENNRICIQPSDIREKVRETRTGSTVILLVDTSSSMGTNRRIERARGACLSLLKQAYSKRDTVALASFHDRNIAMVLPPTRSVERAHRLLPQIRTGGRTPVAEAIRKAVIWVKGLQSRDRDCIPVIALFSDFRPTLGIDGGDPVQDMLREARRAANERIRFLVIDSECGFVRLGYGKKLCALLNGVYLHLHDADERAITRGIQRAACKGEMK